MSATKQTRCPHCTSVFNITDEQLAARGGHVRCGSCLQVFRADQHLVSSTESIASTPQTTVSNSTVTESASNPQSMSMPVVAKEQFAPPQPQTSSTTPKKRKKDDESWVNDLLGELDTDLESVLAKEEVSSSLSVKAKASATPPPASKAEPATQAKKPLFDDEISDLLQEAWVEPADDAPLKGLGGVDKIKESADESWAQALMSELEEEDKKEKAKNYSMELAPQKPKEPAQAKKVKAPVQEDNPEPAAPQKAANASSHDDDLLSFLNKNANVATPSQKPNLSLPLEIKSQPMISVNWGYWLTWSFMCVLATVLLVVQYIYFNFNELSFNEKTRPQMLQLCSSIGCHAPEPPDALLIDIQQLNIRKHPAIEGALQVNAIIFNKADFAQPLPALKLSLLNKKRDVTAARVFQPKEYLQGEVAKNLRRIPPETPIHIQLDIVNPKVDMASYKMKPLYK